MPRDTTDSTKTTRLDQSTVKRKPCDRVFGEDTNTVARLWILERRSTDLTSEANGGIRALARPPRHQIVAKDAMKRNELGSLRLAAHTQICPAATSTYLSLPNSIIGPSPPPKIKSRGRGAQTSHAMDSRFNPAYDPSTDIALDVDEEDDWDQALEALKDRQRWKAQGAERLRAAGFTDGEVTNWEKGFLGGKKGLGDVDGDITSVKWAKKGEGREWDRGKVVDEEGDVKLRAEWGRLKGT
ncbi:hypothetical protein LTR28_012115 [Elasticomyces elasticus]|nr:hypothetical protein LTR28_012115 [Elasticomyces elasticus]